MEALYQEKQCHKIYLYVKYTYEAKYQFLYKKCKDVGTKQITEQANFAYSPLEKGFGTQTKMTEYWGEKQIKLIEDNSKQNN